MTDKKQDLRAELMTLAEKWLAYARMNPANNEHGLKLRAALDAYARTLTDRIAELERFELACKEWSDKTEWVQRTARVQELGKHRADIMHSRIAELEAENLKLEILCDATYVDRGADAYHHACEQMERYQKKRRKAGKEVGTTHSLCDGMDWVYWRLDELEAQLDAVGAGGVSRLMPAALEPVAWFEAEERARGLSLQELFSGPASHLYSTKWHWTHIKPPSNNPLYPLYAAPQPQQIAEPAVVGPADRHLPQNVAELLIDYFLRDELGVKCAPSTTLEKQGEDESETHIWAFWIEENDTTSYLGEDGRIQWFGTAWTPDTPRPQQVAEPASHAVKDVLAERQRQIDSEGWTPEHDDSHDSGQMAGAASCYAQHANARSWVVTDLDNGPEIYSTEPAPDNWPWDESWWKPTTPRRDAVKACALLLAEIERIDRADTQKEPS